MHKKFSRKEKNAMDLKTIFMVVCGLVVFLKILSIFRKLGDGYTSVVTPDGFGDGDKLGFWDRVRFRNDIPILWERGKEERKMSERGKRNIANCLLAIGSGILFLSGFFSGQLPSIPVVVICAGSIFSGIAIHAFFEFKKIRR